MRVVFSVMSAISIINQAKLIEKLLKELGHEVLYKNTWSVYDLRNKDNDAFLWFSLGIPPFIDGVIFPYLHNRDHIGKPMAVYVTAEGVPTVAARVCTNLPKIELIANSQHTKELLEKAGLKVIDWVHHAIDYKFMQSIVKETQEGRNRFKQILDKKFPGKCKIIYFARDDPRKRLDKLANAMKLLKAANLPDYVLILHTDPSAQAKFKEILKDGKAAMITTYGSLPFEEAMKLVAACDYAIFPTSAEGFGLPLLEANALGLPVIHPWIPPLSEFSSKDYNFVFDYLFTRLVSYRAAQEWLFYEYDEADLAEMMAYAIDVYHNKREEYQEYRQKALENSRNWDYRKIYPKLLKHLGIKRIRVKASCPSTAKSTGKGSTTHTR